MEKSSAFAGVAARQRHAITVYADLIIPSLLKKNITYNLDDANSGRFRNL
jgi:hypothetical protein